MALVAVTSARAAEINGTVREVSGDTATVVVKGDLVPVPGDKADIFFKISGGEDEIAVATGNVTGEEAGMVKVKITEATGQVLKDQLARFISANPKPKSASLPSASSSPSAATPGQTESPALGATETELTPTRREVLRYYSEALAKSEVKDFKGALADFNKIIELDPTNPKAYGNRAAIYHSLKQWERCLADANEAIRLNPQLPLLFLARANCYLGAQKAQRAIEDVDEAIRLDPKLAVAYYYRGYVYGMLGKNKLAIEDYTRATELKPDYEDAFFNRAQAYKALGRTKLAKQDLAKVKELEAAGKTNSSAKPTPAPPEPDE